MRRTETGATVADARVMANSVASTLAGADDAGSTVDDQNPQRREVLPPLSSKTPRWENLGSRADA